MLNIKDIEASIEYYEKQPSSLENCRILADLYTCKKYANISYKEKIPFLGSYRSYMEAKKSYQLKRTEKSTIIEEMQALSVEMEDFFFLLYRNTETESEREILKNTLDKILQSLDFPE